MRRGFFFHRPERAIQKHGKNKKGENQMEVTTPAFTASFPNLFKASVNKLNDLPEFSLQALFPKGTDLTEMKAAAQAACEKKWGTDKTKWPANIRNPFRDQAEKAKLNEEGKKILPQGYEEGGVFMNFKTKNKPQVFDQKVKPIVDETLVYPGCKMKARVSAYAYDTKGNRGVAFGLIAVQKVGDGEPLSGRVNPSDAFSPIAGGDEAAPTSAQSMFG